MCFYDGWHAHQILNLLNFCLFCTDSQELPDLVENLNLGSNYNTTDVLQAPPTSVADTGIRQWGGGGQHILEHALLPPPRSPYLHVTLGLELWGSP